MGVNANFPGFMLREEVDKEKIVVRQRRKAWRFEERLRQEKGNKCAQRCRRFVGHTKGDRDNLK